MGTVFGITYYTWTTRRRRILASFSTAGGLLLSAPFFGDGWAGLSSLFAVFALGVGCMLVAVPFEDRLADQTSGYPSRLFTLPVRTRTLVLWPMLMGTAGLAAVWAAVATAISWIEGSSLPVVVPCLAIAVWVAWVQAGAWAPIDRLPVKLLALGGGFLLPGPVVAAYYLVLELPEIAVAAVLCCLWALGCLAAITGVERDRRGEKWLPRRADGHYEVKGTAVQTPARRLPPFRSPERAQLWFNFHHPVELGASFAGTLEIVTVGLALWISRHDPTRLNPHLVLLGYVWGLPVLAFLSMGMLAASYGRNGLVRNTNIGIESPAFVYVRPISSARLISARFRASVAGVLKVWAVLLALGAGVAAAWNLVNVARGAEPVTFGVDLVFRRFPGWHGVAVLLLSAAAILGASWGAASHRLLSRHAPGLGKPTAAALALAVPTLNGLVVLAISLLLDPPTLAAVASLCPWVVGVILCGKGLFGATAFRAAWRRRLIQGRSLCEYAAIALVIASVLLAAVWVWLPEGEPPLSRGVFLVGVLALVPFGRFALLPLALDHYRHV
jgi:hypothetical protein